MFSAVVWVIFLALVLFAFACPTGKRGVSGLFDRRLNPGQKPWL